jgi:3',5'-nucleoside bisphosphate phosphatase
MLVDLQLHSNYSDGYLSPTKLADFIAGEGVKVAALTDHNTVAGQNEFRAACRKKNITAVTGLELYVKLNGRKLNLLWYNFDDVSPELHNLLRESQVRRRSSVRKALEKLNNLKFNLDINKIMDKYNHYMPINHIVGDIIFDPKNLNKIRKDLNLKNPREEEIIHHYFGNKGEAMLRENYLNILRVFKLRKKIGGQLVLCHPGKHYRINKDMIIKLKKLGLDGIEVLSPHHSYNAIMHIQQLARDYNLIETGGSDFHRFESPIAVLKKSWEYFKIDSVYLSGIKKIIG